MILGIGVDLVDISRIKRAIERNPRFLARVYTQQELSYATNEEKLKFRSLAGMWAAKEAFAKATGQGFRDFALNDVEVLHDALSAPTLKLHNKALVYAVGTRIHLSISHSEDMATAYCVIEGGKNNE